MASKDVSNGKMVPKAKTNASSLSNVPPRKYGAHSGLKFKYNLDKDSISKPQIDVGCRTEKKPPPPEDEGYPVLKSKLQKDSKKNSATFESKIVKEKPPTQEAHPGLKINLEKDSIKKSATFESQTKKEKPPLQEDEAQPPLKIKLKKDPTKKTAIFKSQIEKKPPPADDEVSSGLKIKLEKDSEKKSSTFQSKIEKEKQPPRKYGAHSGLKFKFNTEKNVIPKTFIFESLTGDTKAGTTAVDPVKAHIFPKLKQKEVYNTSDEKECGSILEEDMKTLRVNESTYYAALDKNVKVDSEISTEKGSGIICRNSVISLCELKPQPQSSKITNSQPCSTLKPSKIPSKASNLSPVNIRQISKGYTLTVAEHQGVNTLEPPEIASKASNLTSVNVRQISKGHPLVTKESPIPRYSNETRVDTTTVQIVGSQKHKDENHNSGVKKYASNVQEDEKKLRDSEDFYDVIEVENVQDECEILSKKEIANLRSNSVKIYCDLKHEASKITISEACNTFHPPEIASKASNLSSLNAPRISKDRPTVTNEITIPIYSGAMRVDTITMQVIESKSHEECHNSGVKKYASTLEEDDKTSSESDDFYDVIEEENVQDDYKILRIQENTNLCSSSYASFCDLKSQPKSPKITKSPACNKLKRPEIVSKASNWPSLKVPQTSKGGHTPVTKEPLIPRPSDATSLCPQIVDFLTNKEERHKSGTKKHSSILKDDLKSARLSVHNSISMKNVQEDTKISIDNESEDLCSRVAKSLRVLQPQVQTLKISESKARDTSKPQATASKTSKLPILNVQQNLRSQPRKIEEPMTPASPKKYGFHAGLRFSFKEKKTTPVDITFNRTPSVPKDKCFKNEKRDPAF